MDAVDFVALVKCHYPELIGAATPYAGVSTTAEDIVQEVLLAALKRRESLTEVISPRAWLIGAVKNLGRSILRKRVRRAMLMKLHAADSSLDSEAFPLADSRMSRVLSASECLPNSQRGIVRRVLLEGMSTSELSEDLGLPRGTIRVYRHRAVKALRAELGPE